jgi:Uma2 family endonuclease
VDPTDPYSAAGSDEGFRLCFRMMSAATRPRYSIDEYVRLEEYANLKHEYLDGQVWAMAGGTPEHARLAAAISTALGLQLRGKRCAVYSSDARVRVGATGLDTYPDVTVVCGNEERDAGDPLALTNPIVLVEVTSESTEAYDRGDKFEHYKKIPSLQEFVVVSHREPKIEVYRRSEGGAWSMAQEGGAGLIVRLSSIACALAVGEIYADPFAS